jgi:hypothetical protein
MNPPLVANRGLLFSSGATVPADGTDGYQTGCIFQHTDGGNNTALYVNEGSVTSSAFKAIAGDIGAHGITLSGSTGLTLSGTMPTGVNFTGTFTGNAMDFSNATIDPTGSGGPCFIRMGAYGSEIDYGADNHQSGAIRIYTTCSGDISSYDRGVFVCTVTTGAKAAFPVAGLAEANNTGTGPKSLQAAQFIAHLGARSSGAHLAPCDNIAGGSTNGMYGAWLKVGGHSSSVCEADSRVAAAWIDNQMHGTMSGQEYGIFASTGGSRPDGFIGFETTSSGYDQLFYFDETYNSGAGTCVTTDSVPGTQDARMKVYYDGKQYYLALYR